MCDKSCCELSSVVEASVRRRDGGEAGPPDPMRLELQEAPAGRGGSWPLACQADGVEGGAVADNAQPPKGLTCHALIVEDVDDHGVVEHVWWRCSHR